MTDLKHSLDYFGNWPCQVPRFWQRLEMSSLQSALQELCNAESPGALILHGTGGVGKTTLAVYTIRSIIDRHFAGEDFGGVKLLFYLNVGMLSSVDRFDEDAMLEALFELLLNAGLLESSTPKNFEALRQTLNSAGKSLFVLDDVFNRGVLRCMSKLGTNVRVLALTRNAAKASYQSNSFKSTLLAVDKLSDDMMATMLFDFFKLKEKDLDLNHQIPRLAKICIGLPLVAAVVAANFSKLQSQKHIQDMFWAIVRSRDVIADSQVMAGKDPDCDEVSMTCLKLIQLSPDVEPLKQVLEVFLLFQPGQLVTKTDLMIVWKTANLNEVEHLCEGAVEASLLGKSDDGASYVLHELLHRAVSERKKLDCKKPLADIVKDMVLTSLRLPGPNSFEWAIVENRPGILRTFFEVTDCSNITLASLEILIQKIGNSQSALWPKFQGSINEFSEATELCCRMIERSLNDSCFEITRELAELIAKSMLPTKPWFTNIFFTAIKFHCSKLVETLLKNPMTVDSCKNIDSNGNNALIFAYSIGATESVLEAVTKPRLFEPNATNNFGETALWHCAAWSTEDEMITILFNVYGNDLDANIRNITGFAALHMAVRYNRPQLVKFLVEKCKADINLPNSLNHANALEMAFCLYQHVEIGLWLLSQPNAQMTNFWHLQACGKMSAAGMINVAENLLRRKKQLTKKDNQPATVISDYRKRMDKAIRWSKLQELQDLLREDPVSFAEQLDKPATDNFIPLAYACFNNDEGIVKFLLDNGSQLQIDFPNDLSATPLIIACLEGHINVARLLIDRGADVNFLIGDMWSPLMAAVFCDRREIAELLVERGAAVNLKKENGCTALMIACDEGRVELAKLLVAHGANIDLRRHDTTSAILIASQNGHVKIAELLLDAGADVDMQAGEGWTSLMVASQNGHHETVQLLLDRGADVEMQENDGFTALMFACSENQNKVAKILLRCGADANHETNAGETPLHFACAQKNIELVKVLAMGYKATRIDSEHLSSFVKFCERKKHNDLANHLRSFFGNLTDKNRQS